MNPISVIPAIFIPAYALIIGYLLYKWLKIPPQPNRFIAIDGLRGYLAIFVFVHHSSVWQNFILTHYWGTPFPVLYHHLGPTSVFFFFMITSFLFTTRLIEAKNKTFNWRQLYISRVMRIYPLYLFLLLLLILLIAILTNWQLHQPISAILLEVTNWLFFRAKDINGYTSTARITAGVIWSLAFEWLFYFSLPFTGLLLKVKTSPATYIPAGIMLIASAISIYNIYPKGALADLSPFAGGIAIAFLASHPKIRKPAQTPFTSILIIILILLSVTLFGSAFDIIPYCLLLLTFLGIAAGNTLFGLLSNPGALLLGQISYSVYLLHGVLLYVSFHFIPGLPDLVKDSFWHFWIIIMLLTIVLITLCTLTFYFIEKPGIQAGKKY